MDAVWLKIKADILSRPVISGLIVVTVMTSSALLTLALATLVNTAAPYEKTFEELNGAHLWLYLDRDRVSQRDIGDIEALPGVEESTGLRYSASSRVSMGDTRAWVNLRAFPLEAPAVNRLLVQDGRRLWPRREELLASKDLNDRYDLAVGDVIGVNGADGREVELPVIGLAYNPTWDIYRNSQPPYVYLGEDTLRMLFPDETTWDWSIGLRLVDPDGVDQVLASVEAMLPADAVESHTDWRDVKDTATFDARLSFVFLGAFGLFAILAAVLVVASSISSVVLSQFRQIGVLKAVGFTRGQVLWVYLGQYLVLGLVGGVAGVLLGFALSPLPLRSVAVSLSAPYHPPFDLSLVATVIGVVLSCVIVATLGTARRGAQANIIRSIAVGAEPPRKRTPWIVSLGERLGFPAPLLLGLSDAFVRPFRSLLTGLNLVLGVVGILFGLMLSQTVEAYRNDPTLLGVVYDAVVSRERMSDSKAQHVIGEAPGVEAYYGEVLMDVETPAGSSFQVRAVEGDLSAFPFRMGEGRVLRPHTNEAMAGQGLLDWLGLEVGDQVTVVFKEGRDEPVTWRIVGQYPEPANRGQMLMVSLPLVARRVKPVDPDVYYLRLSPDCDVGQLREHLIPREDTDLNLSLARTVPDYIVYLQLAIFFLSAILIGIALINVFNTSLLSMQERLRAIGILKSVGMTPAQVVLMVCTAAGFLGLLAALLGIPVGWLFTKGLLNTLSATYGFGRVEPTLSWFYILLLPPLMVGLGTLGSAIPGWRAARVAIVDVLRGE